jgi:hypothetical protein
MKSTELFNHDVVVVSETHLSSVIENGTLEVDGFDLHRRDRNSYGGGIACYVRSSVSNRRRPDLEREIEVIVMELGTVRRGKIFVVAAYRPPNNDAANVQSWFGVLEEILNTISGDCSASGILLVGDMNCDLCKPELARTKRLKAVVALANMKIQRSTPITRQATLTLLDGSTSTSSTCIDVFAATRSLRMSEPVTGYGHASDHYCVSTTIKFKPIKKRLPCYVIGRNMLKINGTSINNDFSSVNWDEEVFVYKNVDECTNAMTKTIARILDKHAPKRKLPFKKRHVPWMSAELRSEIHQQMKQHARWRLALKRNDSKETVRNIDLQRQTANRRLRQAIINAERAYNEEVLSQKNMAKTWIAMKKTLHLEPSSNSRYDVDPSALNDYFASVTDPPNPACVTIQSNSATKSFPCDPYAGGDDCTDAIDRFSIGEVAEGEVARIIRKLNVKKSHGHDEISARLVKMCVDSLSGPLARLMTMSADEGVFPSVWKKANVTAVWKRKGSPTDVTMYRPISVLTVFAKIMEKIIADRFYRFLLDAGKIPASQYAFRKGSSAEVAMMVAVDRWSKFLDSHPTESVTIVAVDLSRAFDTVDHRILLSRLTALGVGGKAHCWFQSYLSGRVQRVVKAGETTPWRKISRGVPQGGSLSPLLFVAYTAELPEKLIQSHSTLFADDLTFDIMGGTQIEVQNLISANMSQIDKYCTDMKLIVNHNKTQIMQLSPRCRSSVDSVMINGASIPVQTTMKLLGVVIDSKLDWSSQADAAAKKARTVLGILRSKGRSMPVDMKRRFYDAAGKCHLDYCSNVVGGASKTVMNKLETVEREAQRVMSGKPPGRSQWNLPRMKVCGTMVTEGHREEEVCSRVRLRERFDSHLLKTVCKALSLTDEMHPELCDLFNFSVLSSRGLAHRLKIPKALTRLGRAAPSVRASTLFNQSQL